MDKNKTKLINIVPMRHYEPPNVPTLDEMRKDSAPLQKLPKRWTKSAAVAATIGVLGLTALSGCDVGRPHHGGAATATYIVRPTEQEVIDDVIHHGGAGSAIYFVLPTEQEVVNGLGSNGMYGAGYAAYGNYQEFDMIVRIHHGGSGGASYVVHLTEQEVLGIIRRQLEAAGLEFGATPPPYTAFDDDGWMPHIGLVLFDAARNTAVSHISFEDNHRQFIHNVTNAARESFAEQTDIRVGVFETPAFFVRDWDAMGDWYEDENGEWTHIPATEPTAEEKAEVKAEARPILEERVNEQIQDFIAFLRELGVVR